MSLWSNRLRIYLNNNIQMHTIYHILQDYTGKDVIFLFSLPYHPLFKHSYLYFDCISINTCVRGNCFRTKSTQNMKNWFWLYWNNRQWCRRVAFIFFFHEFKQREIDWEKKRIKAFALNNHLNFFRKFLSEDSIWCLKKNCSFCLVNSASIDFILPSKYFQNKIYHGIFFPLIYFMCASFHRKFLISMKFALNMNS